MKVLSIVLVLVLSSAALADVLYYSPLESVVGNPGYPDSWQLRSTTTDGSLSQGWFAFPVEETSNQLYADAGALDNSGNTYGVLPGMSGQVVRPATTNTYARGIQQLPILATRLAAGDIVSVEATISFRTTTPETGIMPAAGIGFEFNAPAPAWFSGPWYSIAGPGQIVAGLDNGGTTRKNYVQINTPGAQYNEWGQPAVYNVLPNTVTRIKLDLNGATDQIRSQRKLYVGGAWETSWTTLQDWNLVPGPLGVGNLDISAGNVNGIYMESGRSGGAYYQIDDVLVTPEPATMALLGLGGLVLLRKRK